MAIGDPEDYEWNEHGPSRPRLMAGVGHRADNRISATFPLGTIDENELDRRIRSASDARKEKVFQAYAEQAVMDGCQRLVKAF
jgi:hypothetical protein